MTRLRNILRGCEDMLRIWLNARQHRRCMERLIQQSIAEMRAWYPEGE